jgi:molecular chaperone DnaK
MTISGGSALPKDEIDRMVRDAEAHAEEDRVRREEAETRNSAEQLVYSTEKFLTDNDANLPTDGKEKVKEAVEDLKKALASEDAAEVKAKHETLARVSQELGSSLYAQQAASAQSAAGDDVPGDGASSTAGADGSGGVGEDDVVDAEIVEEDR